ncbi:MAG: hypothetical protein FJX78_08615 [Armatimonadetes bacterium]|nr:hypothetical protein [Armatimonadota bacterium]
MNRFLGSLPRIAGIALLAGALTIGGGDGAAAPAPKARAALVVAIRAEPDTLDPHATGSRRSYAVMKNICDTLVVRAADNPMKNTDSVSCTAAVATPKSRAVRGKAGRYMSMDIWPNDVRMPITTARRVFEIRAVTS